MLFRSTTTNKLGSALAVGASFAVLEVVIGFVPGGDNSQTVLDGLLLTYTLGAIIGLLAAWVPMIGYPLTKSVHAMIRQQLEARQ